MGITILIPTWIYRVHDAILLKYSINSLFSNTINTIYPHSMLIDLKPFVTFAPIPMN